MNSTSLYWVEQGADSRRGGFFCLWYSTLDKEDRGQQVTVQPLALPEDLSLHLNEGTTTTTMQECAVSRDQLFPLDPALVKKLCSGLNADYLLALIGFSHWDNMMDNGQYIWPSRIVRRFVHKSEVLDLTQRALLHPLNQSKVGSKNRAKIFLFLLCAEHVGLDVEESRLQLQLRTGQCSAELSHLLKQLSSINTSSQDNHATRTSSRAGPDYQADIPAQLSATEPLRAPHDPVFSLSLNGTIHADRMLRSFLGSIHDLQQKLLAVGFVVEVPRTREEEALDEYEAQRSVFRPDHYSPKFCDYVSLSRTFAELRMRKKRKATTLGIVQDIVRAHRLDGEGEEDEEHLEEASVVVVVAAINPSKEGEELRVPLKLCRVFSIPADYAFETLFAHRFDVNSALDWISKEMRSLIHCDAVTTSSPSALNKDLFHMNDEEAKIFLSAAKR